MLIVAGPSTSAWGLPVPSTPEPAGDGVIEVKPPLDEAAVERARQRRRTPAAEAAPTPLPKGLPIVGQPGEDAFGMPLQYVDRPALRSLLFHKKYAELTRVFERLQEEFEADPRKEYWPSDAADVFGSAEPSLRRQLDAWVQTTPGSFAPYLARGAYLNAVAWAMRGGKWARETPASDFAAMAKTLPLALADLDRALALQPKSIGAYVEKLFVLLGLSRRKTALATLEQATTFCPSCFVVRTAYMMQLLPRWGGSYPAMNALANSVGSDNQKLALLRGYADWDKSRVYAADKDLDNALAAINRACSYGDHWLFLVQRADVHTRRNDLQAALDDLNAAEKLRPGEPAILLDRVYVQRDLKRWEDAGRDLLAAVRTAPTARQAQHALPTVVKGLIFAGWQHHKVGRREDSLRLLDLAAELDPQNRDLLRRRAFIVEGRTAGPDGSSGKVAPDIEALRDAIKKNPNSLRAHQQLDYNLARQGKFTEVVEMWNGFIARRPREGRAYLERGGAKFHLGQMAEAKADAAKACALGIAEGCRHAR